MTSQESTPTQGEPIEFPDLTATGAVTVEPGRDLYPPIEPYAGGLLDVGEGHQIYWEECGNPQGKPVVFLHGGPGGGGGTDRRRFFDPESYRIIVFDQRGCGKSMPHAADDPDLSNNTTGKLIDDIEQLRRARGVTQWQVFGGSWGSTLALAYAEKHPAQVTELVLRGIYTLRRKELDFYYNYGASEIFPEWWEVFCEPLRRAGHNFDDDNIVAYHELLFHEDPAIHGPAAVAWTAWEAATSSLVVDRARVDEMAEPRHALAFARIENHYFVNGAWLAEGQLLDDADRLANIPTTIVQGRWDMPCAATTALELHRRMPHSELKLVLAGHAASEPHITSELLMATDKYRDPAPVVDPAPVAEAAPTPADEWARPGVESAPEPAVVTPDGEQAATWEPAARALIEPQPPAMDEQTREAVLRHLQKVRFSMGRPGESYRVTEVDDFIDEVAAAINAGQSPVGIIRDARFPIAHAKNEGYDAQDVDGFVDRLERAASGRGFGESGLRLGIGRLWGRSD